jgi:transcriptional regulator with XRE-family HTH domain
VDNPVHLLRLNAGLTQKELAEKMDVTQAYISKLERTNQVSTKALKKVSDLLN